MALVIGNAYSYVHPNPSFTSTEIEVFVKNSPPKTSTSKDGSVSIHITGGKAPYTTHIAGTNFPAETFYKDQIQLPHLGEGTFTIIVQDQNKKIVYKSIEIKVQ